MPRNPHEDEDDALYGEEPQVVVDHDGTTRFRPRFARTAQEMLGGSMGAGATIVDSRAFQDADGKWRPGAIPVPVGSHELPTDPRKWQPGNEADIFERVRVDAREVQRGGDCVVEPTVLDYDPRDPRTSGTRPILAPLMLLEQQLSRNEPVDAQKLAEWLRFRAFGWYGIVAGAQVPARLLRPPRRMLAMLSRRPDLVAVAAYAQQLNEALDAYARAGHRVVASPE